MTIPQTITGQKTDFELLLRRLREAIIRNDQPERAIAILKRRETLLQLSPEQCLEWSRLAQMSGEMDIALDSLAYVNDKQPDMDQAWIEHWELLNLLGKGKEAASLRARALTLRPDLAVSLIRPVEGPEPEEQDFVVDEPFFRSKREEELILRYMQVFQGREDCFARQWADKQAKTSGYVPVRKPITPTEIREHLSGLKTYGIYLLQTDSRVRVGVLDADLKIVKGKDTSGTIIGQARRERDYLLERTVALAREDGLEPIVEFSGGKGYHFWFAFEEPQEAARVRGALGRIAQRLKGDLSFFQLEVFPKQDKLAGKGFGNLVKLPLGIHRAAGKPSYFLPRVEGDIWQQLESLKGLKYSTLCAGPARDTASKVLLHPRQSEWLAPFAELKLLIEKCPALGRIIMACRNSKSLGVREEKILFSTIGFLKRGKTLTHALMQNIPEYNPHLVDYRLSMQRGTPLGCRKIHSLLNLSMDFCDFVNPAPYPHPLLHFPEWSADQGQGRAERVSNLQGALDQLRQCISTVIRFLPDGKQSAFSQENPGDRAEEKLQETISNQIS